VACRDGAKRNTYRVSLGKPERKSHLGDLRIRRKSNMTMELKNRVGGCKTGFIQLTVGTSGGLL